MDKFATFFRVVKPGEYNSREDALDVFVTDFQFHAQKPNNPRSMVRNFARSVKKGEVSRTFSSDIKVRDDGAIEIGFGFNEDELLTYLRKVGKTILRVYMPTKNLPVGMAQDLQEKLRSIDKKLFQKPNSKQ